MESSHTFLGGGGICLQFLKSKLVKVSTIKSLLVFKHSSIYLFQILNHLGGKHIHLFTLLLKIWTEKSRTRFYISFKE